MARVEIGEIVAGQSGRPISGGSVQVNVRNGAAATVYVGETGAATLANPLSTDAFGRIEGWLNEGSYDLVVTANGQTYTQRFDAVAGSHFADGLFKFKNLTAFTFSGGAHDAVAANLDLIKINQYGDLIGGQNLGMASDNPDVHGSLFDFRWSQRDLRFFTRNQSMAEIADPCDLSFTRFGPESGYPYAGGSSANLTGVDVGATIGEIRCKPAIVPFGGDLTTIGARAAAISADITFYSAERHRDLTGNQDYAVGTAIRLYTAQIGRSTEDLIAELTNYGGLKVGRYAVADNGTVPLLHVRGDIGQNQKQTVTISGTPTGGSFTLTFYNTPPASPGFVGAGQTTAGIAYNATATDVKNALEALGNIGVGNLTATGGPLPGTPVVVEWTGATKKRTNYVRLKATSSLTGGTSPTVATSISQDGIPDMLGKKMLHVVHGGQAGDTPTEDYALFQNPGAAGTIWRVASDGVMHASGVESAAGVSTKTKAGALVDGDFAAGMVASGLLGVDTADGSGRLYARVGTNWRYAAFSGAAGDLAGLDAFGMLSWTHTPMAAAAAGAPVSQQIHVVALPLRAGQTVTNLWVRVIQAGAGTVPTSITMALLDSGGTRRALTAELKNDAKWTALGWKSFAVGSPFAVTTDGVYYVAFLQNGAWGTTALNLGRGTGAIVDTTPLGSNALYPAGNVGTGQTAIGAGPLTVAVAATDSAFWFGVN